MSDTEKDKDSAKENTPTQTSNEVSAGMEEPKKSTQIEVKDAPEESADEIDLKAEDKPMDDETIDETLETEKQDEAEEQENGVESKEVISSNGVENDENEVEEESTEYTEANNPEEQPDEVETQDDVAESEQKEEESEVRSEYKEEQEPKQEAEQLEDLNDKKLEDAVDDIVREESDDAIALDDAIKEPEEEQPKGLKKLWNKITVSVHWWWNHKLIRNLTLLALFVGVLAITLIPVTRYTTLNLFGVRVSSSMRIVDSETSLPLKNITVTLQDAQLKSDEDGMVEFSELKLGSSELSLERRGYAQSTETIVLGLGSNPLGDKTIVATGLQYTFVLSDWISDAQITDAAATAGEYSAKANEQGEIVLTIGEDTEEDLTIAVQAAGYRDEVFDSEELRVDESKTVYMVNDRKHVFVNNRDNRYDLYTVDLDGQNTEMLLQASGEERDIPQLFPHSEQQRWALVSTHEDETNADDYILDVLYVIDTTNNEIKRVGRSERIDVVGWRDDFLIFWQVVEGTSRGNAERSKLFSYNNATGERIELAAANYFNDVELLDDTVLYAVSGFAVPESYARLFEVNVNGEQKVQVLDKQVFSIFRTGLNELLYSAANQEWFEQTLPDAPTPTTRRSSVPENYSYVFSPSGELASWVRVRNGQGVLQYQQLQDNAEPQEAIVDAGIRDALYWVGDEAIVYRIVKSGETADYIVSLDERPSGEARNSKISDITVKSFNGF